MKLWLILALLFATGCQAQTTYTGASFTWTPQTEWTACVSGGTTACVYAQTLSITTPSGTVTSTKLQPSDASYQWTPGGTLSYGIYTATLVTNAYDDTGAQIVSPGDTVQFGVHTGGVPAPTGLAVVVK